MTRQRALHGARVAFVLLTVAGAWWGFRDRWDEVGGALAGTGPLRLAAAVALTALDLAVTGVLWRLLLRGVGSEVGVRDAAAVFFVGQLGKYVPGSVWSIAVQAQLGRRHDVPARSSVTASAVFLLVHTATGLLLGGLLLAADGSAHVPVAYAVLAAVVGAVVLAPPLLRRLADLLAGQGTRFGTRELATATALMAAVWLLYGGALLLLVPASADAGTGAGSISLVAATAAFALAHAAGVLVVLAPAGVGAREGVLVVLLAPALGVPAAAAVALLSRVAHALADFTVAGLAAAWARHGRRGAPLEVREPARAHGR
ncbi:hypothetical protein GCM10023339_43080 [Alloalcanivorax gelatiniphagus]